VVRGISFSLSHLHVCHGHSWFRRRNYSKEFGKDVVSALPDLGLLRRHPSVNSYGLFDSGKLLRCLQGNVR